MSHREQHPPAATPDGCTSLDDHERQLTGLADELGRQALALMARATQGGGFNRIELASAKELALASIKARAQAADLTRERELVQHERWMAREARTIKGLASADARPRLVAVSVPK